MKSTRLDKYLADAGLGTRSEVKNLLKKRFVLVNGSPCVRPEQKITSDDEITCQGRLVRKKTFSYYMLNKPAGVISATEDSRDRTVLDLLQEQGIPTNGLFPVGRLDKDTEGLLLITDDGALAHHLLSPRRHVNKTYFARIDGEATVCDIEAFSAGLDIGDRKKTLPARLEILSPGPVSEVHLTVQEGRFHQVKRMFLAQRKKVLYLKRISMGKLSLDPDLLPGRARPLTEEEVSLLRPEIVSPV
ncbi:MAG: 16S rRNA pseudouridine(516) synthase [Lachnospiraceae bacterium]|nr:16S rRNA pseudouridine(516) synthase [Lachnospiraceae bacterium]